MDRFSNVKKYKKIILCSFVLLTMLSTVYFSVKKEKNIVAGQLYGNEIYKKNDKKTLKSEESFKQGYAFVVNKINNLEICLESNEDNATFTVAISGAKNTQKNYDFSLKKGLNNVQIPIEMTSSIDSKLKVKLTNTSKRDLSMFVEKIKVENKEIINLVTKFHGETDNYHFTLLAVSFILCIISVILLFFSFIKDNSRLSVKINAMIVKISKKCIHYIIEVFLFFIVILSLMSVFIDCNYFREINVTKLLILLFVTIIFSIYFILLIIHANKNISKLFVIVALPIVMLYIVLLVPNSVPDELPHFNQAYRVSFLKLDNPQFIEVPKQLVLINNYNYLEMWERLFSSTDYSQVMSMDVHAGYNFVVYIFSGFGIALGRLFHLSIAGGYILGRFCNAVFYIAMLQYAIKKIPFGKIVLFVYALSPMILQEAISISADSVINTISLFSISYILYVVYKKGEIVNKNIYILGVCFVVLGLSKYIYLPIFMLLLLSFNKIKNMNKKQFFIIALFVLITGIMYYYFMVHIKVSFNSDAISEYLSSKDVNAAEQIRMILTKPIYFIKVIINTLNVYGEFYFNSMFISPLGWLNIMVVGLPAFLYFLTLGISLFVKEEQTRLKFTGKALIFFIATLMMVLVFMALYVAWSAVGSFVVLGVQGRYFIPAGILICLIIVGKKMVIIKNYELVILISLLVVHSCTLFTILKFFRYANF